VTWSRSSGGRIREADIAYNVAYSFTDDPNVTYGTSNIYYIQDVMLHELGIRSAWLAPVGFGPGGVLPVDDELLH